MDHQEEEEGNEAQEEGESLDVPLASVQKNYGCSWDLQDQFDNGQELVGIYTRGCDCNSESDCGEDDHEDDDSDDDDDDEGGDEGGDEDDEGGGGGGDDDDVYIADV